MTRKISKKLRMIGSIAFMIVAVAALVAPVSINGAEACGMSTSTSTSSPQS